GTTIYFLKVWFESSDPTDLYLPALVLASKFLHDSDTYDRASNSDWAEAANISNQHLNQLEWEFVQKMVSRISYSVFVALSRCIQFLYPSARARFISFNPFYQFQNWNVMVDEAEFERWLSFFESWVANDFVAKNGFCTYNELLQLSSSFPLIPLLQAIISFIGLMTAVYTVSIMSLLAVPSALSSLETTFVENHTIAALPSIAFLPEDSKKSRIPFIPQNDNTDEFDTDSLMYLIDGNSSVVECNGNLDDPDCIVHKFDRFSNSCLSFIGFSFTDYSVHPFVHMVS
ncbi:unnamed protein product, partial [Strongylus vulgaris]